MTSLNLGYATFYAHPVSFPLFLIAIETDTESVQFTPVYWVRRLFREELGDRRLRNIVGLRNSIESLFFFPRNFHYFLRCNLRKYTYCTARPTCCAAVVVAKNRKYTYFVEHTRSDYISRSATRFMWHWFVCVQR